MFLVFWRQRCLIRDKEEADMPVITDEDMDKLKSSALASSDEGGDLVERIGDVITGLNLDRCAGILTLVS